MSGEQRWVGVEGFHGGGLALKNELGIHVGHEMPGGQEHGDVAARVHDDVLFASGEPPSFEQRQHLAARLVDVDDAAAVGGASIVQCPLDLLLAQFSECPCRCFTLLQERYRESCARTTYGVCRCAGAGRRMGVPFSALPATGAAPWPGELL